MNREGQAADGGIEASVKSFSVTISYVAFIFKVSTSIKINLNLKFKFFVFLILWKVSFNYLLDIKGIQDAPRIIKILKIIE
jgi:hypothetical protein